MATVAAPIDATSTAAWKALEAHQEKLEAEGIDLKAWFAADAERVNKLSFDAGDLHFDLSKNLVTDETVKLLCDLAREVKLEERRDAMFSGEHINRKTGNEPGSSCRTSGAKKSAVPKAFIIPLISVRR